MTRALYTLLVGVIVMLAVPVSQLRLVVDRVECCCPDPEQCKCPDHDKKGPSQTTIQACHKKSEAIANAASHAFAMPTVTVIARPAEQIASIEFPVTEPHEPPSLDRPRGPS